MFTPVPAMSGSALISGPFLVETLSYNELLHES